MAKVVRVVVVVGDVRFSEPIARFAVPYPIIIFD